MNSCSHDFLPEKKDSVSCPVKGKASYENADVFIVLIIVDLRANSLHGSRLHIYREVLGTPYAPKLYCMPIIKYIWEQSSRIDLCIIGEALKTLLKILLHVLCRSVVHNKIDIS